MEKKYRATKDELSPALVEAIRKANPGKSEEEIRAVIDAYKARKEAFKEVFMEEARKRLKDK